MVFDVFYESHYNILDDAIDEELEEIDDILADATSDLKIDDCIIPDSLVDEETDDTDFEKYMDDDDDEEDILL